MNKDQQPDFKYENLIKHTKEELERIKLAQEISTYQNKLSLEKQKHKNENIRIFALAFMTAIISLGTTYIIKLVDQRITEKNKIKDQVNVYIKEFMLTDNQSIKKNLACTIGSTGNPFEDSDLSVVIQQYKSICDTLKMLNHSTETQKQNIAKVDTLKQDVKLSKQAISTYEKELRELDNQYTLAVDKQQRRVISNKIKDTNKDLEAAIQSAPSNVKSAINSTDQIQSNLQQQIGVLNKKGEEKGVKQFEVKWFKEGYYLVYDNIKILLQEIDRKNNSIKVQVCQASLGGNCQHILLAEESIKLYEPLMVRTDNGVYKITLQAIDRAGKNPFDWAGYILVELQKQ